MDYVSRYKLPLTDSWRRHGAISSPWREPFAAADGFDPAIAVRDFQVGQSSVVLAADIDIPAFLDACQSTPLLFEVHDRDAKPEALPLAMPRPDLSLDPPPKPVTPPTPVPTTPPGKKKPAPAVRILY